MKWFLFLLVTLHGLIHLLGFVKAFNLSPGTQLTQAISRPVGLLWLLAALLFAGGAIFFLIGREFWWIIVAPALIISQILILTSWNDAKIGTIPNVIILVPLIYAYLNFQPSSFASRFRVEVQEGLKRSMQQPPVLEEDIRHLPAPVQKYLKYAGVVGKPRVQNVRARFSGGIKPRLGGDFLGFVSQQYNFFDDPTRVFYIKSAMYGIPFDGLHLYKGPTATMQIRIASLIQIVDAKGPEMNQGETVTLFNDMCMLAPARLIDRNIAWRSVDSLTVEAKYSNKGITITAMLFFNDGGELINFTSDDRFESADGKTYNQYRWSTPLANYRDIGGRRIASYGETMWDTPEGKFTYGKFNLLEVEYNCTQRD